MSGIRFKMVKQDFQALKKIFTFSIPCIGIWVSWKRVLPIVIENKKAESRTPLKSLF